MLKRMTVTVTTEAFAPATGIANNTVQVPCSRAQLVGFALTAGRPWRLSGGGLDPVPVDTSGRFFV
jgi:hypothetical protein